MSPQTTGRWESLRTDETRQVEQSLGKQFAQVDAYRYNRASIRVRIIDPRFEGYDIEKRDNLVEPELDKLPVDIQGDIMNLLLFYPGEVEHDLRAKLMNLEFEEPSPSML